MSKLLTRSGVNEIYLISDCPLKKTKQAIEELKQAGNNILQGMKYVRRCRWGELATVRTRACSAVSSVATDIELIKLQTGAIVR